MNHFLPGIIAGTEIYTFNLALSLQTAGIQVAVLIPNFDSDQNTEYLHEGIRVIKYAENSESSREMILGKVIPTGLAKYKSILQQEKPDIVHFQEVSAGRGIGMYHVETAALLKICIVLTCHLSTYSCQTGTLVYKDERLCDGVIRNIPCTACTFHARGIDGVKSAILQQCGKLLYASGINTGHWNSSLGTALGFSFVIDKKRKDLLKLSRLCDKIIVLTNWYHEVLLTNGVTVKKLQYFPQAITGASLTPVHKQCILPLRVVFIGRISKYKGVHLLLDALRQLPADKISVDIFGPVTEDEYGQQCVIQSKEMYNVRWKGVVAPSKVINMLNEYDLLCLPSTFSEMSPLVIQEAFAANIPVLASQVYGNSEQIQDGVNGWLFDFKNVHSLTEKLGMLIKNPILIDQARDRIPATRSFDEVAAQHNDLYHQILVENKKRKDLF